MKRIITLFSFFALLTLVFTSCEEDKYLDWKYQNEKWLQDNYNETVWQKTASGLEYRMIYAGIGDSKPTSKSEALVKYTGTYITGKVFDSTDAGIVTLSEMIPGFQEALKMMKKNAIYEFRIPQGLAYGKKGHSGVPPYSTLIFRLELKEFWTR